MTGPFDKEEAANMAVAAAEEIENLRAVNASLGQKAHAYDLIATILALLPRQQMGAGKDIAQMLRKRAAELREPGETDDGA